jgi:adenylate cyclase class 2
MTKRAVIENMEVEVKARCDDLDEVETKALALGARFEKDVEQSDIFLSHPSRDFGKTDESLRMRWVRDRCYLTYKGPRMRGRVKAREEIELEVGDGEGLLAALERLGFRKVGEVTKLRRVLTLDDVEDLGTFVEVEVKDKDIGAAKRRAMSILKSLGLEKNIVRMSYFEMLRKIGKMSK